MRQSKCVQVVVLIAEILVGLATLRQGFSLVRRLDAAPAVTPAQLQRMVSSGKVRGLCAVVAHPHSP